MDVIASRFVRRLHLRGIEVTCHIPKLASCFQTDLSLALRESFFVSFVHIVNDERNGNDPIAAEQQCHTTS
jgi:hypothetical protein